jgi:hypothetical protein
MQELYSVMGQVTLPVAAIMDQQFSTMLRSEEQVGQSGSSTLSSFNRLSEKADVQAVNHVHLRSLQRTQISIIWESASHSL